MHSRCVIHRDIKPENMLLSAHGANRGLRGERCLCVWNYAVASRIALAVALAPSHIASAPSGVMKLCDFGFAREMLNSEDGGRYSEYVATRW